MNIPINVWYYNELSNNWLTKSTPHYQETKDELDYFRVLSNGRKYFYNSAQDYIKHNEYTIVFDYLEDNVESENKSENDSELVETPRKKLKSNVSNASNVSNISNVSNKTRYITDINGTIIT